MEKTNTKEWLLSCSFDNMYYRASICVKGDSKYFHSRNTDIVDAIHNVYLGALHGCANPVRVRIVCYEDNYTCAKSALSQLPQETEFVLMPA